MSEEKNKDDLSDANQTESEKISELQQKIEDQIASDEDTLKGDDLSAALSKDRTHMSEHRTHMSEHRTGLSEKRTGMSEHRTELSAHRTGLSEQRTEMSDTRTDLSYQRTALSYERTLMAWIRTSTSLISFGFTLYKVFEELDHRANASHRIFTPRIAGMTMILFGFLGLLFAEIQHRTEMKKIKINYPAAQKSLSSILAVLILIFGFALFMAVLFRQ